MSAHLTVVKDTEPTPRSYALPAEAETTMGRRADNTIVLSNASVSSAHCVIRFDGGQWQIKDRGSTNGTKVNGAKVSESELKDGDLIAAGDVQMRFECSAEDESQGDVLFAATLKCPQCGARLVFPDVAMGKPVRCGVCEFDFEVDGTATEPFFRQAPAAAPVAAPEAAVSKPQRIRKAPAAGGVSAMCGAGDFLRPELALSAHEGDAETAALVQLERLENGLAFRPQGIPRTALVSALMAALLALCAAPFRVVLAVLDVIGACLSFFGALAGVFGGNVAGLMFVPYRILMGCVELCVVCFNALYSAFIIFRMVVALVSGGTFVRLPPGMRLKEGVVAALSAQDALQVLRIEVPVAFLQKKAKASQGFLRAVVMLLFWPFILIYRAVFGRPRPQACLFAFVRGEPLELSPPSGRFDRLRRKRALKIKRGWFICTRREVYVVAVAPEQAGEVEALIQGTLGVEVIRADEAFLSERLWIA
jgi:hypothetical protein